jgi:hypothetical protein
MAREERTFWDAKPHKPIRYGLCARITDWQAGRADGRDGIPQLPPIPPATLPTPLTTHYLDALNWVYQGSAQAENLTALRDVADARVRRRALRQDIADLQEKSRSIRKRLDALGEVPDEDALSQRNAVEQHADPLLIRARRLREHAVVRKRVQAAKERVDEEIRLRQVDLATVTETITVRRWALEIRVTRLHAHAMERRARYIRRLARNHPDGPAITPYFGLSTPQMPGWLENWPGDEETAEVLT